MRKIFLKSVALLVFLFFVTAFSAFADIAFKTDVPQDNYNSSAFWLQYAVRQAGTITDPNCKNDTYGRLGRAQALTGDVNGANLSASVISDLYKRVIIHTLAAKTFYKQGNISGYKKSMEQARSAAMNAENIGAQIFINGDMVSAYLDCNDVNGAWSYSKSIKVHSEKLRSYQTIAAHLARYGDIENADSIINEKIGESRKEGALLEIAETCVRSGNLTVAEKMAGRLNRTELKDRLNEKLGVAFAEIGNIEKAGVLEKVISDSKLSSSVIAAIAKYQINSGDINLGKKTADEITYRDYKIAVYTLIAEKQADTGNIDSAVATIETIEKIIDDAPMPADESKFGRFDDSFKKGVAETIYLHVANALAKRGDTDGYQKYIDKAVNGVKEINVVPPMWKGTGFIKIIDAQLKANDIAGAKKTVKEIDDEHNLSWGLFNIVQAQLEINDVDGAITTYRKIKDPMNKSFACGEIASALVKKGSIDKAKQILSDMGNSPKETEAYRRTAREFVETQHSKELADWLEKIPSPQAKVAACIGAVDDILKIEKNKNPAN